MNPESTNTQSRNVVQGLQQLVEKQIDAVKKSDFRTIELLSEQAGPLVLEISKIRLSEQHDLKDPVNKLLRCYKQLELMVSAEKETVRQQLQKLGKGIKTIQVYQSK